MRVELYGSGSTRVASITKRYGNDNWKNRWSRRVQQLLLLTEISSHWTRTTCDTRGGRRREIDDRSRIDNAPRQTTTLVSCPRKHAQRCTLTKQNFFFKQRMCVEEKTGEHRRERMTQERREEVLMLRRMGTGRSTQANKAQAILRSL